MTLSKKRIGGFNCDAAGHAASQGLYDPACEHDSCGTGFAVRLDGMPRHDLVRDAVQILINLEHRGALGGDKATSDGAGLLLQMPDSFLRNAFPDGSGKLPPKGEYAVGMVFMPSDKAIAKQCEAVLEEVVRAEGCEILGWRHVPVDPSCLGQLALSTRPEFRQVFIAPGSVSLPEFERKLYVIRRMVENRISRWQDRDTSQFYVASLSSRTIVYKGMLTGTQLQQFFPDLASPDFKSAFCIVHQRYSTNTLPAWALAQPFRFVAHNGEINTLRGNINHMRAREPMLQSPLFGEDIEKVKPVVIETGSDSAIFDNALELLVAAGRSIPHAMMMMIPEAFGQRFIMSEDKRFFYEFSAATMEPWDGPAAMVFTDGARYVGATLDRNGLRPCRYTVTRDGMLILASETGVLPIPDEQILRRGRLQAGKMLLVDLEQGRIVSDSEIKGQIARQKPYRHWVKEKRIELRGLHSPSDLAPEDPIALRSKQHAFGYTEEELKMIVGPMAANAQEPLGSMGNDAALAVLSNRPQLLFAYFKQLFAQVTNPPIDPLREELVMSLMSFVGCERNLLDETPEHVCRLKLHHPILTTQDMARLRNTKHRDLLVREIPILYPAGGDGAALQNALDSVFTQAEQHIRDGANILILTDSAVDAGHAPIPVLLASSGLHHHLIRAGLRNATGIIVETGEAREVIHFALLIAYGANAVCPSVAFSTVAALYEAGLLEKSPSSAEAMDAYMAAIKKGLLKTFSRMGISTVRSFFGSQIFEAVGLGSDLINKYFTGTASRIEGIGLQQIAEETNARHRRGFPDRGAPAVLLDVGGHYHLRHGGEKHLWTPESIYRLQQAVRNDDYATFKTYTQLIDDQSREHATLRSLMRFRPGKPIPIDEVEPVDAITRRFVTAAMSYGSISKEAHEAIAIAMNRIGGRSNSGEGGEDPARYVPLPNGDSMCSRIKQVASGRFGVTTEYLINARELQIKIAQGAKPGEGGQLPAHKVTPDIARVRHTTPGVSLVSPPPHHDIYSIEDLAQLIYDLKMANPQANVSVKLVSEVGVGTIAAGVAKAKADLVLIAGHDGGTGASPLTSIKHTGLPWELGLAETQQCLIMNHLRDRIVVQTDGQLKTGRDLAIAALMGAEEFGFGTTVLVALGCVMMRKCHLSMCPVGVATQDPRLRCRFTGKPEYVVRFLRYMAQELREKMAELGFRTVDEMIGRVDMLEMEPAIDHYKAKGLDFSAILAPPDAAGDSPRRCIRKQEHLVMEALDQRLISLAMPALENGEAVHLDMPIRNVDRTVGATLSGELVKRHGASGLPPDTIQLSFKGSAGQSLGAFLAPGITIRVEGDANDYVGKSLSGGKIIVVPPARADIIPQDNILVGNVVLYGATSGEAYFNGMAGERFAVRNSGASAVVEGVGDHGCEYMTAGVVVVLGSTGYNFAAGMSGGIAYVYDETELFETRCNLHDVDLESVWSKRDVAELRSLIENHYRYTNSQRAQFILENWSTQLPLFVKVMPVEYRRVLERMKMAHERDSETISATEEVYSG